MRKKFLSIAAIAAALLVSLSFTTQVFATSVTTSTELVGVTIGPDESTAVDAQQVLGARRDGVVGQDVTLGTIAIQDALDKLKDLEGIARIISKATGRDLHAADIAILDSMEVTPAQGLLVSAANPVSLTFSFPGITESTRAYVIHYENGEWVVMPTTVGDELVTGTFTSLSPVAVVVEKATLKSSVLGANRSKSPRTGDERGFTLAIIAGGVAILVLLGVIDRKFKSK